MLAYQAVKMQINMGWMEVPRAPKRVVSSLEDLGQVVARKLHTPIKWQLVCTLAIQIRNLYASATS